MADVGVDDDGKTPLQRLADRRARAKEAMDKARKARGAPDSSSNLKAFSSASLKSLSNSNLREAPAAAERSEKPKKTVATAEPAAAAEPDVEEEDDGKTKATASVESFVAAGARSATFEILHQTPLPVQKNEKPPNVPEDTQRATELRFAVAGGDKAKVEELLATNPESIVWARADDGATVTTEAAQLGFATILALLLKAKAPVNMPDEDGVSPLMYACGKGSKTCVKLLLACGADPDAKDNDGITAADFASSGPVRALLKVQGLDK